MSLDGVLGTDRIADDGDRAVEEDACRQAVGEEASLSRHPGVGEDVEGVGEASLGMGLQVGEVLARGGDRAACLGRRATLLLLDAASRRSRARPTGTATR